LARAPDKTGEMIESFCKTRGCELEALVVRRAPLHLDQVERFGKTPTNTIVIGNSLGGVVPPAISQQITQKNQNVVEIDGLHLTPTGWIHIPTKNGGYVVERGLAFDMSTAQGRKRMSAEKCQFKTRTSPVEQDKNVRRAKEILSKWNLEEGKLWNREKGFLSNEQMHFLANTVTKSMHEVTKKYGVVKRSRIVLVINMILRLNGYAPIPSRRNHRRLMQVATIPSQ
jgi:hypothetical protein